jgi:hypothetical protein
MARTALTPVAVPARQSVSVAADAADLAFTAGDAVEGNSVPCTGKEIVVAWNTDVGAQTITIDAPADEFAREGAITAYSIGADEIAWFGLFHADGWKQTDGTIHIDVSDAGVELAVLRVP